MSTLLEIKNRHPRDDAITLDEQSHTYTINGEHYMPVTTWIHSFFPAFNAPQVIAGMKAGRNWTPDNPYFGMNNKDIIKMWADNGKEAASAGTAMHKNIENYYNGKGMEPFPELSLFQQFLEQSSEHLEPYRTEWKIYSKKYQLAGSVDIVFIDPKDRDKIILADWKRVKEIKYSNEWEKGREPLTDIDNCNYWHYALQLNVYRVLLEQYYGKTVSEMFLVVLHPNQTAPIKVVIPRLSDPILKMFKHRKKCLEKN